MNVGFVHLGCSKNLIDTEAVIGKFKGHDYKIVNNEKEADIIVINTCGFIDSAKEEAINTILEMTEYKKKRCKYLIVMGCLVQRYYEQLVKIIPEIDLFVKIDEYDEIWEKISNLIEKGIVEKSKTNTSSKITEIPPMPMLRKDEFLNRVITTGENYAYLKIGEGCSNRCTYCAIPYIRGPFVSRPIDEIIEEANNLANQGIKELIIIAQDTTKYGIDLYGKSMLPELLSRLCKIEKLKWIRFLYTYPEGISDELIEIVKNEPKIAKYFDIPIQHISDQILKKMNRKTSKKSIMEIIQKIRNEIPDVTLRTSLIVGFPGETKENFNELEEFVNFAKFDKLGVFQYSKEEGTPAEKLPNQIHGNTKKARYKIIMSAQQKISKEKLEEKIGNTYEVLVEGISFDKKYYIARTMQDVPEIDGLVYIKNDEIEENIVNNFVKCKIIEVSEYDLIAKMEKEWKN
ncbi:MAG: 30S ribosomal protein S12 methylthiotransferase RimO [Clostridia bacterium]|nr:30S ribosomal protein S12 methylthiotransferase RimO [Clostridia bacterium]